MARPLATLFSSTRTRHFKVVVCSWKTSSFDLSSGRTRSVELCCRVQQRSRNKKTALGLCCTSRPERNCDPVLQKDECDVLRRLENCLFESQCSAECCQFRGLLT